MPILKGQKFVGRPKDGSRLEKEKAVYDLLDRLCVHYEGVDHEPLVSAQCGECDEIAEALEVHICKNLFLCNRKKTEFYMLTLPGEKHFVTADFSKRIGVSRLSFAPADKMEELLNLTPGSVSVLGMMNDKDHKVHLFFDEELTHEEFFGCHPCINTSSLKLRTDDVLNVIMPALGVDYGIVRV